MALVTGTGTVRFAGHDENRFLLNGQHILAEQRAHRPVAGGIEGGAEAGIKPGSAVLRKDARIKLRFVPGTVTEEVAFLVMNMAVEFIFAGRLITDGDGDGVFLVQHVVQVKPAVGAPGDIRGIEAGPAEGIIRVVRLFVDHAFIAPVGQVVHRCGPADIVVQAENVAAETVMGAVDIEAAVENVRLAVGNVFPGGQVWVECLHREGSFTMFWEHCKG